MAIDPFQPRKNLVEALEAYTDETATDILAFIDAVLIPQRFELANDVATAANNTPVILTDLAFDYEANKVYEFSFIGKVQPAATTTGCGFQLDLTTTFDALEMGFFHQLANSGTLTGGHSIADNASVGVSSGMPNITGVPVFGQGLLKTDDNAGTAQLMFRSEVNAVTTAKAGFTLIVREV